MGRSYLLGIGAVLIWSTMAALVKALLADIPSLEALAISGAFAFVFMLVVCLARGGARKIRALRPRDFLVMAGLGFLGLFLYSALYYYGIDQLTSQEACILNYLWPAMIVLFAAPVLRERLTPMKVVALACSFAGVVVLSLGTDGGAAVGGNRVAGIAACIAAAACYGLFSVLNKKKDYDQTVAMTVIWLVVTACSTILGLATEEWVPIEGAQWPGILWLGLGTDAAAYLLWALAVNSARDSAAIANIAYLTPFLSLIVSALTLGEQIAPTALVALVLIVGGILLQALHARRSGSG